MHLCWKQGDWEQMGSTRLKRNRMLGLHGLKRNRMPYQKILLQNIFNIFTNIQVEVPTFPDTTQDDNILEKSFIKS